MYLFLVYKYLSVLFYLFLSAVMLYHRLFRRWLKFSLGFFVVYTLGSYFFFGKLPEIFDSQAMISSLPYILFYIGTPLLFGYLLFRQLSAFQILGVLISFLSTLALLLVVTTNHYNRPFGFAYEFMPHARAWIEVGSLLFFIIGLLMVAGYCFITALTWLQTFGVLLIFLGVVVLVASLIWLTIGYEFLGKALRLTASLFPRISA
jgi:hypothetical protein